MPGQSGEIYFQIRLSHYLGKEGVTIDIDKTEGSDISLFLEAKTGADTSESVDKVGIMTYSISEAELLNLVEKDIITGIDPLNDNYDENKLKTMFSLRWLIISR